MFETWTFIWMEDKNWYSQVVGQIKHNTLFDLPDPHSTFFIHVNLNNVPPVMPNSYCEICGKKNPEDVVKFRIFEMGELSWIIPESPNCHHRAFVRRRHQGLEQEELVAMGGNQIAVEWKREGTQPWLWRWRERLWTKKGEYYRFGLQERFGNCLFFKFSKGAWNVFWLLILVL